MAANILVSQQDKKDLDKYIRFFVIKAVQIIVQSRLGERKHTHCRTVSAGSDWFNIGIEDNHEILTETRRVLSEVKILSDHTLNLEISLKTRDGDSMVLEVWSANMDTASAKCKNTRISYTVYSRLGMLLKSLICISRAVPVYKLSRSQGADSFVICYRIYSGTPNTSHLGNKERRLNIGDVATPMGTVQLTASYRSQMLLSPVSSSRDLDLKENYFTNEEPQTISPGKPLATRQLNQQYGLRTEDHIDGRPPTSPVPAPRSDTSGLSHHSRPHIPHARITDSTSSKDSPKDKIFKLGTSSSENTDSSGSGPQQVHRTPDKTRRVGAFAPRRASQISLEEEVPFSLLLEMSQQGNLEPKFPSTDSMNGAVAGHGSNHSHVIESISRSILDEPDFMQEYQRPDEFVFVDLQTPFAVPDAETDLGKFYRSCQNRPDLQLFTNGPTISDEIDTLDIDQFEKDMVEFDDFFNKMEVKGSPL